MKLLMSFAFILLSYSSAEELMKHKPEQGVFPGSVHDSSKIKLWKTLYKNSNITLLVNTTSKNCTNKKPMLLQVVVFGTTCKGKLRNNDELLKSCLGKPLQSCLEIPQHVQSIDLYSIKVESDKKVEKSGFMHCSNKSEVKKTSEVFPTPIQRKRRDSPAPMPSNVENDHSPASASSTCTNNTVIVNSNSASNSTLQLLLTDFMGDYIVQIRLTDENNSRLSDGSKGFIHTELYMHSPVGYLSADEYPLLTFYLIMCIVYALYLVLWLVMSLCNCHDLLRVQYWIGGVVVLGLLEKVVYYSEYVNVNDTGLSNRNMEKFAGFVACFKRAIARMLVVVVSLGFGIVKPRLGSNLYRVLGIGIIYFVVALLIQMMEIDVYFSSGTKDAFLFLNVPLLVIDMVICWWILKSLLQTMKTLRLRRNTEKLSLYRHFANIIVFCIFVSLGMMIYIFYYNQEKCKKDFANSWFQTACWPLLFSVILFVIMILWRPTANNKRYAYSPMIDENDSENEDNAGEPMLGSGATESMKSRYTKNQAFVETDIDMAEENLKWIEENIPPTVADAALPVLMDANDVKRAAKYEMSKMD